MPFVILKQSTLQILRVIFIDIWISSSPEGKGELSHNNSGAITIKPSKVSLFLTIYTDSVFVIARWWLLAPSRKELFSWGRISWSNFKNGKRPGLQLEKKETQRTSVLWWVKVQSNPSQIVANRRGKSGRRDRFCFLGLQKSLQNGDCSHDIKGYLLLERKAMTNLESISKRKDIILPTMVHIVKAMVFPVVIYGCESWPIKKVECWRIDAFELWCWRSLLRVP